MRQLFFKELRELMPTTAFPTLWIKAVAASTTSYGSIISATANATTREGN